MGRGALGLAALPLRPGEDRPPWPPPPGLADEDFWRAVRATYPLTRERTYLNTGGLGPAPYPVLDAVQRTMWAQQTRSETGHRLIEEARAPVARFLGADPDEIAFMRNATEGNATIASGLSLRPGDEVLFESHAHPGGAIPWLSRQKHAGIRVRTFEPDPASAEANLQRIADALTPRTRVLQVSHVTAPTGIRFPVPAIARLAQERGLWFHVDGAQSAGMLRVDLHALGCDSYATSGHKWMGGPHGTGLLYVRRDRLDAVTPTETGAYSDAAYTLPDHLAYRPSAQRFEPGTRDAASVVGLAEAVRFLDTLGMARAEARGQALARHLREHLEQIPGVTVLTPEDPALSGSILTYRTDRVPYDALFSVLLNEYGLRCRVVTEQGLDALRVSTHIFNLLEDVVRVAEATRAALGAPR